MLSFLTEKVVKLMRQLQSKWQLTPLRTGFILIVFSLTGLTTLWVRQLAAAQLALPLLAADSSVARLLKLFLLVPLYYLLLLCYGFLFGEFAFFWHITKRPFRLLKKTFGKGRRFFSRKFKGDF